MDALLVTNLSNIRYLSAFTGSSAYLLVTARGGRLFIDSRYGLQARAEVKGFGVKVYARSAVADVASLVKARGIKSLGFEGGSVSYATFRHIRKALSGVRLKPLTGAVEKGRAVKDASEIKAIRGAIEAAAPGFKEARKRLAAGGTEKGTASAVERVVKKAGADGFSFPMLVASGPRGALPHGRPSTKKVKSGELVIVDMGVVVGGYCSDQTHTYAVGKPTARQKKIYGLVRAAHQRAIEKVRPGVRASEVDRAARDCIRKAGYGKRFGHGTGHGVGLDVHEGPAIGSRSKDVLEEGMVFTVEPGVYIPGWGGVRIEDMVLVTSDGCELLTESPAELKSVL